MGEPNLYWVSKGEGLPLLMLQGGDGDADASNAIAERLTGYQIISYDRRGLSRSALTGRVKLELEQHTDDAARVINLAGGGPVFVFGTSIGATIALDLVARYPGLVTQLIAHEPPATELLPDDLRAQTDAARDEIDALYKKGGVLPAMRKFLAGAGVDFMDREPDVGLPVPQAGRMENLKFFLEHDVPAVRRFRLDLDALSDQSDKIVIAAGEKSEGLWVNECAVQLARRLDLDVHVFPGGHAGYQSHPRGFAEKIAALLK